MGSLYSLLGWYVEILFFHIVFVPCFYNFANKRHLQISPELGITSYPCSWSFNISHFLQVARIILFMYLFYHFYLHYDQVITIPVYVHLVNIVSVVIWQAYLMFYLKLTYKKGCTQCTKLPLLQVLGEVMVGSLTLYLMERLIPGLEASTCCFWWNELTFAPTH